MTARRRIDGVFAAVALLLVVAGIGVQRMETARAERAASDHLEHMLLLRESVLRRYFESLRSEIILWSGHPTIVEIMERLVEAGDRSGADAAARVGGARAESFRSSRAEVAGMTLDQRARAFAAHHRYYDVFFVTEDGDILYTVAKEADLGTNLRDGPFAESGLGRAFRALVEREQAEAIVFEDFSEYAPSDGAPAAFMGSPIEIEGRRVGYYLVQIPAGPINEIMQFGAGLGETGETYLVGEDRRMRSDSRFLDTSSILEVVVEGATTTRALAGEVGLDVVDDYRGVPVLSAHRPFDFEGTRWAVLAEQDVAEVEASGAAFSGWLAAGVAGLLAVGFALRTMLVHAVLPSALGAFFGLSMLDALEDDG